MEGSRPPSPPKSKPTLYHTPSGRKFTKSPSGRRVTFILDDISVPASLARSSAASPTAASQAEPQPFTSGTHAAAAALPSPGPLRPALIHRPFEMPPQPLSLFARFKAAAKALKHEVLALYYAIHDPRTPFLAKVLPWLVLMYALSPLDLIPDFIPVLGLLDDLLLLPFFIWLSIKMIPKVVMAQARFRAETEPLRLSRNWFLAVIIFLLWMAGIEYSLLLLITHWGTPELQEYTWHVLGGIALVGAVAFVSWLVCELRRERRKREKAELERERKQLLAQEDGDQEDVEKGWEGTACMTDLQQPLLSLREESMQGGDDVPAAAT